MGNTCNFNLPLIIDNENQFESDFSKKIDFYLSKYKEKINSGFYDTYLTEIDDAVSFIDLSRKMILQAVNYLLQGKSSEAGDFISKILGTISDVVVTKLNKSNAFLGNILYRNTNWQPLTNIYAFRGRICERSYSNFSAEEMVHIPLNMRGIVGSYRYSVPGVPCIYISSNSYVVWSEMNCPELDKLAISSVNINDPELLYNNILDLTIPVDSLFEFLNEAIEKKYELNVVKHIISCIKSTSLIVACSTVCKSDLDRKFKIEYLIPQLIMRNLADNLIGVAYKSNRILSSNISATNLAIPIISFDKNKKYGNLSEKLLFSDSLNVGYYEQYIFPYIKKNISNFNAKGPSAKPNNYTFTFNGLYNVESTFNKSMLWKNASYDGHVNYEDSVFYSFDEYLLFYKELKYIKNENF